MNPARPDLLPELWRRKHLSPAEQKVVELICAGRTTKEAAAELNLSYFTARNQMENAMRKLGIHTRFELICVLRPAASVATVAAPREEKIDVVEYAI